jgi:hypothetical protein
MSFFKKSGSLSSTMVEYFLRAIAFTVLTIVTYLSDTRDESLLCFFFFGAFSLLAITCFLPLRVWTDYDEVEIYKRLKIKKYLIWQHFRENYINIWKVLYFLLLLNSIFLLITNFSASLRVTNEIGLLMFFLLLIVLMSTILIPILIMKGKKEPADVTALILSLCGLVAMYVGFIKSIVTLVKCGTLFTDWAMTVAFSGAAVSSFGVFLIYSTIKLRLDKECDDALNKI